MHHGSCYRGTPPLTCSKRVARTPKGLLGEERLIHQQIVPKWTKRSSSFSASLLAAYDRNSRRHSYRTAKPTLGTIPPAYEDLSHILANALSEMIEGD